VFGAALPEMFDAILLDAPCSGEGVVRKDPDALKNWSPESNLDTVVMIFLCAWLMHNVKIANLVLIVLSIVVTIFFFREAFRLDK
ncbi:hypothetical protein MJL81_31500, partial [Salmonella enterica subsp. enterica serovar Anatum]|nr:hypothetical protein [Salmonella enterica subsp. enterica serovar Anatum]